MTEQKKKDSTEQKPIEIDDTDLEKAAGGVAAWKGPSIYEKPGGHLE